MAMQQQFQRSLKSIFILSLITIISACGSDDKNPPTPSDTTPTAFSFTAVTGAAVSSEVTSSAITIVGIDKASTISITGGTYAIGTGAFTSTTGTITTGQTVKVKVMTSASNSTAVTTTLTIGGVTGSFSVTTVAADTTPNAFTITPAADVQPSSVNTSANITVAGIDTAVPISIVSGTFSIAGGADLTSGTVSNGQVVTVKTTASASASTAVNAVLTIGGVPGTYTVTTIADVLAPTAQILFPPIVSMTEGNTILVRGSASDAYPIKSVKVNGVTATTTDNFKNWQATVILADATVPVTATTENTITVVTEDNAGNIAADAARVAIRQAPPTSTFPDANTPLSVVRNVVIDKLDGRNRLLLTDRTATIFSIDLTNGKRTGFATTTGCNTIALAINPINKHVYATCDDLGSGRIVDINLADPLQIEYHSSNKYTNLRQTIMVDISNAIAKVITVCDTDFRVPTDGAIIKSDQAFTNIHVFSDAITAIPNADTPINNSWGIAHDEENNRYLVSDYSQQAIFAVNATTGVRSAFANNTIGSGDLFGVSGDIVGDIQDTALGGLAIDELNKRALVTESSFFDVRKGKIFAIDLITGNRTLLSGVSPSNSYNSFQESNGIAINDPNGYAFIASYSSPSVLAVDLVTGHRVVFSKAAKNSGR